MTTAKSTDERTQSRATLLGAAFALGFATLLLGAAPADAGNEFKKGFKDEFGRIVAHQVAAIGHAAILPVVVHREVHYDRPVYGGHRVEYSRHYAPPRHRGHHRGHHAHRGNGHHRQHVHQRGCGHTEVTVIEQHVYRDNDYAYHDGRGQRGGDSHGRRGR